MSNGKGGVRLSIRDDQIRAIITEDKPNRLGDKPKAIGEALRDVLTR